MPRSVTLAVLAALAGCGAESEDGIFQPGFDAPVGDGDGAASTGGDALGSSGDSESDGPLEPDVDEDDESDGMGTADDGAGSSDGAVADTCPDALLDTGYTCPTGSTFSTSDGFARCTFERISLPAAASVSPYCQYLADGYLGFSWSLTEAATHVCPPEARYAPTETTGYCLWEDIELPAVDVTPDCNALLAGGGLGFRWACPS